MTSPLSASGTERLARTLRLLTVYAEQRDAAAQALEDDATKIESIEASGFPITDARPSTNRHAAAIAREDAAALRWLAETLPGLATWNRRASSGTSGESATICLSPLPLKPDMSIDDMELSICGQRRTMSLDAQAEIEAFGAHLRDHRQLNGIGGGQTNISVAGCRFCEARAARKAAINPAPTGPTE